MALKRGQKQKERDVLTFSGGLPQGPLSDMVSHDRDVSKDSLAGCMELRNVCSVDTLHTEARRDSFVALGGRVKWL